MGSVNSCLRRRSHGHLPRLTGYENSLNIDIDDNDGVGEVSNSIQQMTQGISSEVPWSVPVEETGYPVATSCTQPVTSTSSPSSPSCQDTTFALSFPVQWHERSITLEEDDSNDESTYPKAIANARDMATEDENPPPTDGDGSRQIPLLDDNRRKLERCSEWLQRNMKPESIVRQLKDEDWLTFRQEENILAQPTRWEKVASLLDIILRGSNGHYHALLLALQQQRQEYLADGLRAGQPTPDPSHRLPLQYQEKLRQVHLKDVPRSNRELNRALGFDRQDQLLYARLSLDTGQIQKAKYKEDYVRRAAENFQRPEALLLEDVFNPVPKLGLSAPRTVLLVGGAGMGKTTASHKIALNWAKMEEVNKKQDVQALYKFECRKMNKVSQTSLSDLIFKIHGPFVRDPDEQEVILEKLDTTGTQIILDGLDELLGLDLTLSGFPTVRDVHQTADVHTIIHNLFKGNLLPQARLLFTSRPNDIIDFREFDRVVIALGFDQKAIKQCMLILCENDEQICEAVMEHITCTTQLYIHCVVPLACVMLGIIVRNELKQDRGRRIFLDRSTQVYIRVVLLLLACRMDNPPASRFKLLDIRRSTIFKLMDLAAHGTLGTDIKNVFTVDDIGQKFTAEDLECGLLEMTTDYPSMAEDLDRTTVQMVSFIHLSFQEFFAAVFLALAWEVEVLDRIFKPHPSRMYDMALLYLAGLLGDPVGHKFLGALDPNQTADVLKDKAREMFTRMADRKRNIAVESSLDQLKRSALLTIECLNEGHMSSLVPDMEDLLLETEGENAVLDLCEVSGGMFPHQVAAVAYFVNSSRALTGIDLGCSSIGPRGIEVLATRCAHLSRLKILRLEQVGLMDAGAQKLVPLLQRCLGLEVLVLGSNNIGPVGAQSLAEGCREFRDLVEFRVHFNPLTDAGMELLAPIIANNKKLKKLSLDGASLTDDGAVMLSRSLELIDGITELRLVANGIGDEGAHAIGSALRDNHLLQRIYFKRNDISISTRRELKKMFEARIHV